ncbi:MAG: type II secretion system F family protein [Acidobacteriaceae bacterium]
MFLGMVFFGIAMLVALFMLAVTRPSASDKAVRQRITNSRFARQRAAQQIIEESNLLKVTHLSRFGWLDRLLARLPLAHRMQETLEQTALRWDVGDLLLASVAAFVVVSAVAMLWAPSPVVAAGMGVVAANLPYRMVLVLRSRRVAAFDRVLPDAIEMMSRALQAGQSVSAALDMVASQATEPLRSEFAEVAKRQNLGLPFREALMQMSARIASSDLHFLVTAILVQKETGGNLIEILGHTSEVIRERIRIRGEVRTYTAQGRMTGWILALLPLVLMVLMDLVNPGYARVLLDDPTGRKLLYVGMGMLLIGGLLIRKIVDIEI